MVAVPGKINNAENLYIIAYNLKAIIIKCLVSSLDWLRRRKRADSEVQKHEEMYVGNTLLKQKQRLRVRNAAGDIVAQHEEDSKG